jgi:uncharacterized protein (TIGR02271 family)
MHHDLSAVQRGWTVYDTSDEKIGDIADIGPTYLLVQKGLLFIKDLYIPASAITETDAANGRVHVNVAKGDVDAMGWEEPPVGDATATDAAGTMTGGTAYADTAASTSGTAYADTTAATGGTRDLGTEDRQRLTLHEEELQAQTRREQAGEVEVRKHVVEDAQEVEVPVTHEEVEVRRVRVNREATASDAAFTDDGETIRVPVTAETVEVTKTPRVVEEIEISKRPVTERQTVRDTVRREEAEIDRQGDVVVGSGDSSGSGVATSDRDLVGAGTDRFERTSVDDAESDPGRRRGEFGAEAGGAGAGALGGAVVGGVVGGPVGAAVGGAIGAAGGAVVGETAEGGEEQVGSAGGGVAGTVAGSAIGGALGGPPGAVIGGAVGAGAGSGIGDQGEEEIEEETGSERGW